MLASNQFFNISAIFKQFSVALNSKSWFFTPFFTTVFKNICLIFQFQFSTLSFWKSVLTFQNMTCMFFQVPSFSVNAEKLVFTVTASWRSDNQRGNQQINKCDWHKDFTILLKLYNRIVDAVIHNAVTLFPS